MTMVILVVMVVMMMLLVFLLRSCCGGDGYSSDGDLVVLLCSLIKQTWEISVHKRDKILILTQSWSWTQEHIHPGVLGVLFRK